VQELFGWRSRAGALAGTLLTIGLPVYIVAVAPQEAWKQFWTLFGSSNQLLAALTLLAITVWLYQARRRIWFTLIPMSFVLVITLWSLINLVIGNLRAATGFDLKMINAMTAAALIGLALYLAVTALIKFRGERVASLVPEPAPTGAAGST
jgi:carbon starvation protein